MTSKKQREVKMASKMDQRTLPTIFDRFVLPEDLDGAFRGKCSRHCTKTISGTIEIITNWLKYIYV